MLYAHLTRPAAISLRRTPRSDRWSLNQPRADGHVRIEHARQSRSDQFIREPAGKREKLPNAEGKSMARQTSVKLPSDEF